MKKTLYVSIFLSVFIFISCNESSINSPDQVKQNLTQSDQSLMMAEILITVQNNGVNVPNSPIVVTDDAGNYCAIGYSKSYNHTGNYNWWTDVIPYGVTPGQAVPSLSQDITYHISAPGSINQVNLRVNSNGTLSCDTGLKYNIATRLFSIIYYNATRNTVSLSSHQYYNCFIE